MQSSVTIKLQLNDDLRRVKVNQTITFQELSALLPNFFREVQIEHWKFVNIKYLDNENDLCSVTTDDELQEAFKSFSNSGSVLKLILTFPNNTNTSNTNKDLPQQNTSNTCNELDGLSLMDGKEYAKAIEFFLKQVSNLAPWKQASPLYNVACCEALLGNIDSSLAYLARSISCGFRDVEHILSDPDLKDLRPLEAFQVLVAEISNSNEQHQQQACTQRPYRLLQQRALHLMKCGKRQDIERARELLLEQLRQSLNDWQQRIPLYNLACCEAILGNISTALSYLEKSVTNGYCNLKHLLSDPDLASLRSEEAFQQIVATLRSGHNIKPELKKSKKACRTDRKKWREPQQDILVSDKPKEDSIQPQVVESFPQQQLEEKPKDVATPSEETKQPELVQLVEIPKEQPTETPKEESNKRFQAAMEYLEQMGFLDKERNAKVLLQVSCDLTQAVRILLD